MLGYKYELKGFTEINQFAKGVLALVNIKSSEDEILNVKTIAGTNFINVIAKKEINKNWLETYFEKVISVEKIKIMDFNYDNLNKKSQKEIEKLEENFDLDDEVFFTIEI